MRGKEDLNPSYEGQVPIVKGGSWLYPNPIKIPMKERLRRMRDDQRCRGK